MTAIIAEHYWSLWWLVVIVALLFSAAIERSGK